MSYFVPFGTSAIFDSIIEVAEILRDTSAEGIRKLIYVFTDNESNMSVASVDDVVRDPMDMEEGMVKIPEGPGIGVVIDEEKVARYRVDF